MARDDVSIANLALLRIGVTKKIASLQPPGQTQEAIVLIDLFDEVRDRVLAAAPWPFARKMINLQLTGDTPIRWKYRYEYPNDCVSLRALLPDIPAGMTPEAFRLWQKANRVPYELEDSEGVTTICTDQETAVLEYTVRVTNPTRYDAVFTSAFAWALGAEAALPLAKTIEHSKNAAAAYNSVIADAIAKALNEEVTEREFVSEFERSRL